eukprot:4919730-Alexandrium_andersonii.AAC.1
MPAGCLRNLKQGHTGSARGLAHAERLPFTCDWLQHCSGGDGSPDPRIGIAGMLRLTGRSRRIP